MNVNAVVIALLGTAALHLFSAPTKCYATAFLFPMATTVTKKPTTSAAKKVASKSKTPKVDPVLIDKALDIYQRSYPPVKQQKKRRAFNASFGMPNRDLDGTKYSVAKTKFMDKTFADRTTTELQATFTKLANVYGDANALRMVQDMPIILTANPQNFAPSLAAFSETFGMEPARAMVQRNPGLLFLKPTGAGGADTADNLTMQFSYIVAATRPAGPFLLCGLLLLLCSPAIELVTGIPLKETLTSVLPSL
ncbi:hypothetical protein ACA910_001864 [Epithemia clementina (nom. ined.)]